MKRIMFLAIALTGVTVRAAIIEQTVWNADWNSAIWGSPAATPVGGAGYKAVPGGGGNILRMPAGAGNSTFGGGSLEATYGVHALLKNQNSTATINGPFTLSGASLNNGPTGGGGDNYKATLAVSSFSVTEPSTIYVGNAGGGLTVTVPLRGAGDLYIGAKNAQLNDTVSFSGIVNYTGAITVGANAPGSVLSASTGALTVEFGSTSYAFSSTFTLLGSSILRVNSGQTLTFDTEALSDPLNGTVAPGTYVASSLGANYAGDGTIVVGTPPSAPGTTLLVR